MFKALFGLIKLCLLAVVLALVFHNYTSRLALSSFLKITLGVPVSIESAQVDLLASKAFFRNIVIHNPEDFPEGYVAKIPYLLLDLDFAAFSDGRLHFEKIEVDVGDFQIQRAADGRVNWLHLKIIQEAHQKIEPPEFGKKGAEVDHFVVTLRKGTYRDFAKGGPPRVLVLEMESQDYLNVHTLGDMVNIVSWEAMKRMGLEKLGAGVLDQIREDLDGGM
jgi:hypothetical protein